MKKLIPLSIVAGFFYFAVVLLFSLTSTVVDGRVVSLVFGGASFIAFDLMFGTLGKLCDFKVLSRKFWISFAVMISVAFGLVALQNYVWSSLTAGDSTSWGWVVGGAALYMFAEHISKMLRKGRDNDSDNPE